MRVHAYEKAFLLIGGILLIVFMGVLAYTSLALGVHLPGHVAQVDPAEVRNQPPFDQPGVRHLGGNRYEVVLLGSAWQFVPNEVRVPAGAEVTFIATATDVLHGFHVERTRINVMLIPGQIARTTYTFDQPGEHLIICHEYCGAGHHIMFGKVVVE
jgi:cytochrome c oxidase subunit 2